MEIIFEVITEIAEVPGVAMIEVEIQAREVEVPEVIAHQEAEVPGAGIV